MHPLQVTVLQEGQKTDFIAICPKCQLLAPSSRLSGECSLVATCKRNNMSKIALLSNESLIFLGLFHPETVSPPFLPDHVITPQLSSPQLVGLHLTHSHSLLSISSILPICGRCFNFPFSPSDVNHFSPPGLPLPS